MSLQKLGEISLLLFFMLMVGVYYITDIHPLSENLDLKLYVVIIMAGIVLFSVMEIVKLLITNDEEEDETASSIRDLAGRIKRASTNTFFKFLALTVAYFFLINYVGFFTITALYVGLVLLVLGINKKLMVLVVPVFYCLFVYVTFEMLLDVSFPRGFLF